MSRLREFFSKKHLTNNIFLIGGLVLFLISQLVRYFNIPFFWESYFFGIPIILIGIILWLNTYIKYIHKKKESSNAKGILVAIKYFFVLITVLYFVNIFILSYSCAFKEAKAFCRTNPEISNNLGEIAGFGKFCQGTIHLSNEQTNAILSFVIMTANENYDVTIELEKKSDTWHVTNYHLEYVPIDFIDR